MRWKTGASRVSSVFGLNATPQTANRSPSSLSPKCRSIFLKKRFRCSWLISSTACRTESADPASDALFSSAFTSFGRHDPPYPSPGKRNFGPMRESDPIPSRILSMSAPTASLKFARSFM